MTFWQNSMSLMQLSSMLQFYSFREFLVPCAHSIAGLLWNLLVRHATFLGNLILRFLLSCPWYFVRVISLSPPIPFLQRQNLSVYMHSVVKTRITVLRGWTFNQQYNMFQIVDEWIGISLIISDIKKICLPTVSS